MSQIVHAIYNRYEFQPTNYLPTSLLLVFPPVASAIFYHQADLSLPVSLLASFSTFYIALISSIIAYRLSPAHPLYDYPGPLIVKISKLWMMHITVKGKMNEYVKSLHDRYGPYVRVGTSPRIVLGIEASNHNVHN